MANLSRGDDSTLPLSQHPTRKGGNLSQESHSDHQASSQSSTAQVDHGHSHVLRFVPNNLQARLEFHQLALMKLKGGLNEHHAQFLVIEGMKLASDSEGFDVGANSSSEDSVADKSKQEDPIYHGYFLISLEFHPTARGAKWVIGKGSSKGGPTRSVDILLAGPDSASRKGLAAAHAFLTIHGRSGAWMIRAGQICGHTKDDPSKLIDPSDGFEHCEHHPVFLQNVPMKHASFRCLDQPRSSLLVRGLLYDLQFCVDTPEKESAYLTSRNSWLEFQDLPLPTTHISGIPFESDIKTRLAIFRHGLGSGSFGTVFEGFDPRTGDLRAIKKLVLKSDKVARQRREVEEELEVSEKLSQYEGIVTTYGWCNSHQGKSLDGPYPLEVFLFQEKGIAFDQHPWPSASNANWREQRNICKQLLHGIQAIHELGWMHRDINPKNILYFPDKPAHAALCDFGKLFRRPTDTDTILAAWCWLPPEIVKGEKRTYNQKIDMWMLSHALLYMWLPHIFKNRELRLQPYHQRALSLLKGLAATDSPPESGLFSLLYSMIAWDPQDRPTAQQALEHPSMQGLDFGKETKLDGKRAHE